MYIDRYRERETERERETYTYCLCIYIYIHTHVYLSLSIYIYIYGEREMCGVHVCMYRMDPEDSGRAPRLEPAPEWSRQPARRFLNPRAAADHRRTMGRYLLNTTVSGKSIR